jgi:V/A-type H+-transporting ATPase subunit I
MLKPEKMVKVNILCIKDNIYSIIEFLHEKGVLHIIQADVKGLEKEGPLSSYDAVVNAINEIEPIIKYINEKQLSKHKQYNEIIPLRNALEKIKNQETRIKKLKQGILEKAEIDEKIKDLNKKRELLEEIKDLISYKELPQSIDIYAIKITENLKIKKGEKTKKIENEKSIEKLINEIRPLSYSIKGNFIFIIIEKNRDINNVIARFSNAYLKLPETNLKDQLNLIKKEIKDLTDKAISIENEIKTFADDIKALHYSLTVHKERAEIARHFAGTKEIALIQGWLPYEQYENFKNEFNKMFYKKAELKIADIDEHERPPTYIKNPNFIKPFELAYSFSSLPSGNDWNSAFFYFITFPFFYGMILGDVAYSILSIIIALYLKQKFRNSETMQKLCSLWLISSIGGIIWGLIYDEWLGVSHTFWLEKLRSYGIINEYKEFYKGISRIHDFSQLLMLCIIFGVIHLLIGYLLNIINELGHNIKHAVASFGWFLSFLSLLTYIFFSNVISFIGLAIGILLILKFEGINGLFEIPALISLPASYLRIAAVGLSGVIIAELINFMVPKNLEGLNIFVLILVIGLHFINTFIAMFESTVQAGRLQIIEFGTKFIKGGGYKYKPFMLKRGD